MKQDEARPDLTVVVPISEPPSGLTELLRDYAGACERLGRTYEMLVVVDGGQAWVVPQLRKLREVLPALEIVVLGRTFGESAALSVGFSRARGRLIATLPSYEQVDAAGLGGAIEAVERGADMAIGKRNPRIDSAFNRIQTKLFHGCVRILTGASYGDISNGLRVIRPTVADELEIYGDLHRFIPIIARSQGFKVVEVDVRQSPRQRKLRVERFGAYVRRVLDLLTVFFLAKFTRKPLRFFGLIGTVLLVPGSAIVAYLGMYRLFNLGAIGNRPLLMLGVLTMVLGFQTLCIGMLGEVIIFVHARNMREYTVADVIGRGSRPAAVPSADETVRS